MNIIKNKKNILYLLLTILIIAGVFYGLVKYQQSHNASERLTLKQIISLPEQEKVEALNKRINVLKKDIRGLKESDNKYPAYIQLAEAQIENGDIQQAIDSLNSIPEDKRATSRYVAALSMAILKSGDTSKAREMSFNNILLYDEDPLVWLVYFEAFADTPPVELDEAYKKAIEKTKSNVDIMISYAKFSEKIGDKATAVAAWETAANVDPANEVKYREEIARLRQ